MQRKREITSIRERKGRIDGARRFTVGYRDTYGMLTYKGVDAQDELGAILAIHERWKNLDAERAKNEGAIL